MDGHFGGKGGSEERYGAAPTDQLGMRSQRHIGQSCWWPTCEEGTHADDPFRQNLLHAGGACNPPVTVVVKTCTAVFLLGLIIALGSSTHVWPSCYYVQGGK